jgi:hypothetical protein
MLQAGRSRVRVPMRSLDFSVDQIVSAALWPRGRLNLLTEMSTRNLLERKGGRHVRLTSPTSMSRLSEKCGSLDVSQPNSQDSVVGIATGDRLDDRGVGVWVQVESRIFSTSSRPALGPTQPPIERIPGALPPRVKWQRFEADHSPRTSAEVKKMWIYTSTPLYAFMM